MIWSDFHFYSETLDIQTAAYVLLPEQMHAGPVDERPLPTLYLLHGLSDDHTMWLRNTRIAQTARRYRLAVVMPASCFMAVSTRTWTMRGSMPVSLHSVCTAMVWTP